VAQIGQPVRRYTVIPLEEPVSPQQSQSGLYRPASHRKKHPQSRSRNRSQWCSHMDRGTLVLRLMSLSWQGDKPANNLNTTVFVSEKLSLTEHGG
jgi:hypothetical protein